MSFHFSPEQKLVGFFWNLDTVIYSDDSCENNPTNITGEIKPLNS